MKGLFLESGGNGEKEKEIELVFICRIDDFSQLKKADSTEMQEQWEIKTVYGKNKANGGTVRVRKTDNSKYELAIKKFKGSTETEMEVTKDIFNEFKKLAPIGQKKLRHKFNIPDSELVWEVDIYFDENGNKLEWCKVDLEVPNRKVKVPEFPIEFAEVITDKRTEEQETFCNELFNNKFYIQKETNMLPIDGKLTQE